MFLPWPHGARRGPLVLGPAIHIYFQAAEPLFQDPASTHIILEDWFPWLVLPRKMEVGATLKSLAVRICKNISC